MFTPELPPNPFAFTPEVLVPADLQPRGMIGCQRCRYGPAPKLIASRGDEASPLVIVGEAPGKEEADRGEVFCGPSGQLLNLALRQSGLDQYQPWITNTVKCFPGGTPKKAEVVCCADAYLKRELAAHPRRVILALGGCAQCAITGCPIEGVKARCGDVEPRPEWGATVVHNLHPAAVLRAPSDFDLFLGVFLRARAVLEGQWVQAPEPTLRLVSTLAEFDELKAAVEATKFAAADTESTGLNHRTDPMTGLCFAVRPDEGWWLPVQLINQHPEIRQWVVDIFANPTRIWVFHNVKYDLHVLRRNGIEVGGKLHDTLLASYVDNETLPGKLEAQAMLRLGVKPWKNINVDEHGKPYKKGVPYGGVTPDLPLDDWRCVRLGNYGSRDAAHTLGLTGAIPMDQVTATRAYKSVMRVARHVQAMEDRGLLVDLKNVEAIGELTQQRMAAYLARAREIAGRPELNLGSPKQLADILFRQLGFPVQEVSKETGEPSTNEATLKAIRPYAATVAGGEEFLLALLGYRKAQGIYSKQVQGILERIHPDGRVRTNYTIAFTRTGRFSSEDPNVQNVPKVMRCIFKAPENYVLGEWDFAGQELVCAACLSGDPVMLDDIRGFRAQETTFLAWEKHVKAAIPEFDWKKCDPGLKAHVTAHYGWHEPGVDLHRRFASLVTGKADRPHDVTKEERTAVKRVVFGILYCKSLYSLKSELGDELAQSIWDVFFSRYTTLGRWIKHQQRLAETTGRVETPFGRHRQLPTAAWAGRQWPEALQKVGREALRQAVNTPIQSSSGDITIQRISDTADALIANGIRGGQVATVHDSILFELHEGDFDRAAELITTIMEAPLGIEVLDQLTMQTEAEHWAHWGGDLNEAKVIEFLEPSLTED